MEKVLDKKRKRKVYYFVLGEILNGLNELQRECKVEFR